CRLFEGKEGVAVAAFDRDIPGMSVVIALPALIAKIGGLDSGRDASRQQSDGAGAGGATSTAEPAPIGESAAKAVRGAAHVVDDRVNPVRLEGANDPDAGAARIDAAVEVLRHRIERGMGR